ncbi:uncharacterized protein DUF3237 [Breoghania corrubedonensis]|uniref:UPF0311 protein C8N35_1011514 n=1 Tax=Breoghania corrubedonensis TaxID=665038 RepID=A0A2T5VI88_9HYPH|nr:DUF3237 domain-containing protein [Breoghania corrubedonensis]PTW63460.1 uncharacterized protein DUF3237 [Breoghania corrubedonensis]
MLELAHLADLTVELGPPLELGDAPKGRRRIIPITGGTVSGARLSGTILSGGADWQTVFADGSAELDTRYMIETHDGATIDIRNFGYRHGPAEVIARLARGEEVDAAEYYMRTAPRFETGDGRYAWLNHTLVVGTGARQKASVTLTFYEVL